MQFFLILIVTRTSVNIPADFLYQLQLCVKLGCSKTGLEEKPLSTCCALHVPLLYILYLAISMEYGVVHTIMIFKTIIKGTFRIKYEFLLFKFLLYYNSYLNL
jgi:hypothetical protein